MQEIQPRALITGAGKRLGRAMAIYVAHRGFDVAVHYARSKAEVLKMWCAKFAIWCVMLLQSRPMFLTRARCNICCLRRLPRRAGRSRAL